MPEWIEEVAEALLTDNSEMGRLENILNELREAIIICDPFARILLFNPQAKQLFNHTAALNLGHSLYGICHRTPFEHAIQLLQSPAAEGALSAADPREVRFVCATVADPMLLTCHMRYINAAPGPEAGYVLTFNHVRRRIDEQGRTGNHLARMIEDLRGPLTNLHVAADNLQTHPEMTGEDRRAFETVIATESADLIKRFGAVVEESRALTLSEWPLSQVYSADLIRCVIRQLHLRGGIKATMAGIPLWLEADPHSLTLALTRLVLAVKKACATPEVDIEVQPGARGIYFNIVWQGEPISQEIVESWRRIPIPAGAETMTVADVLERHHSDMWCQRHDRAGYALLRIPAPAGRRQWAAPPAPREEGPGCGELYLGEEVDWPGEMANAPLSSLAFVVFTTLTTGEQPRAGDDILAIAGVRVVNGRILSDESFQSLVNPYRPIPESSVARHRIGNDTVRGEPPIKVVLAEFLTFAGDAVLAGKNAGLAMAFIRREEKKAGVRFAQPVLDPLLLSAVAGDRAPGAGEGAAQMAGDIRGGPTVMGECLATAQSFIETLGRLEGMGITTLGAALAASQRVVAAMTAQQKP